MLNKIMLIGNLGRDPEMSYTQTGTAITKFSVAVSRRWKDKQSGDQKEETTWFNVVAFDRQAEICNQYLHKGSRAYFEGRMTSREYVDKDGNKQRFWEVHLLDMQMLDPKQSRPSGEGGGEDEIPLDDIPF